MTGNEIRKKFLNYFKDHGHTVVDSSSLVPEKDPTLLFVNAGMVQFKTIFMGEDTRNYTRATTSQRCVRAGGKHNDLENVGYTARHHTFFEMLGNFSFGDYFKEDAIRYAWEFLTKELAIPTEDLWVSIFDDDDEAYELWDKVEDLKDGRIVRMGEKDNFWSMGDTGPCGPCSEIHIDQGVNAGCGKPDCKLGCECDRFLELWNLVFMQFNRSADGTMEKLPKPSIDTGMGLERVAAVLQGKLNNYDSDLFTPVIAKLEELSGRNYGNNKGDDTAMRVIADHARATTFLVADGVLPLNEGRGYVLRRIMRRAVRYGKYLGLEKPFMDLVTKEVSGSMVEAYPHLRDNSDLLTKVVNNEEARFRETLEHGLDILDEKIAGFSDQDEKIIDGDFIFKLYDTFGFPVDIVRDISLERGIGFDEAGFAKAMEVQRKKSRAAQKGQGMKVKEEGVKALLTSGIHVEFTGYDGISARSVADTLLNSEGLQVEKLSAGEKGRLFAPVTPFYAEAGGQVGDVGIVTWNDGGQAAIEDTVAEGNITLHEIVVKQGTLQVGSAIELRVEDVERKKTAANHTSTHLLQAALKKVLGEHVKQSGSLVGPERLRFDFTHFSPLTQDEIHEIERIVNENIRANIALKTLSLAKEEAIAEGATALFGEKYDDTVRVVSVGEVSKELCGGTHVTSTGEIGIFKILSEGGIAAGVRRVEALAGSPAFEYIQNMERRELAVKAVLNVQSDEIITKIQNLLVQQKAQEKQIAELSTELATSDLGELLKASVDVAGVKVVAAEIPLDSPKTLREVGDKVRDNMDSGVAVLGGTIKGKVALLAIVTKDLTGKIKAGDLIGKVAAVVGGKGGGRPDMAQAGGPMTDKLSEAIRSVPKTVTEILVPNS